MCHLCECLSLLNAWEIYQILSIMAGLLSGAAFGAAMLAAGFHHPSIVISQLKFENYHMIQAFLTATATSV